MTLRERIKENLIERKKKVEEGGINCIPSPFTRFRRDFPGVERGKYYLVSGATKAAKSQITNYLFVYNTVLYCYFHPNIVYPKIFYFPLEETPENITLRFMAFLLYKLTKGKVRISPMDLKSTDERKPLSQDILDLMENEEFKAILDLYEDIVSFEDLRNPTGIFKTAKAYAENNGKTVFKDLTIKDEFGIEKKIKKFDYYIPNNPNEYIFILVDHIGLIDTEKDANGKPMDLRESINKLSEYMIILRNRYSYIPVIVQQQGLDTTSLEAFKANKIRPTVAGLSDSKYTAKDASVMIGITNPFSFELPDYLGYDLRCLKGNARFLEIVLNREGQANGICPLFFDGAINEFEELPLPTEVDKLKPIYDYAKKIREERNLTKAVAFISYGILQTIKNMFKNG